MKMLRDAALKYSAALGFLLLGSGCTTTCPRRADVPNASYVGPYLGMENNLSPKDFSRDLFCASDFKQKKFPNGYVTVYGSSKIQPNEKIYVEVVEFARQWTRSYGDRFPIMTGAGPGIMEAGSRGANEAGGKSIGYTTYYFPPRKNDSTGTHPYEDDPTAALNKYVTDGLIFSSVAMREDMMILHSAAVIIAPGGTGTEWETFQILETLKSQQLKAVPVYLIGDQNRYWKSFSDRLCAMQSNGLLPPGTLPFFEFVDSPSDIVARLKATLIEGTLPKTAGAVACAS